MQDSTQRNKPGVGHFGRLRALGDNGWLGRLKRTELALWNAYSMFADREGIAYPNGDTLAKLLRNKSDNHIGKIRRSLAERGLLEVIEEGGGRGKQWRIKLLTPPCFTEKGSHSGNPSITERFPKRSIKVPILSDKGSQNDQSLNKEEQPIEQLEQSSTAAAPRCHESVTEKPVRSAGAKKPSKRAARKLSDEQEATRKAFCDWYTFTAWPKKNAGVQYEFDRGRDGAAVMKILGSNFVKWDLDKAKSLAVVFLKEPDEYLARQGRMLYDLAHRINRFTGKATEYLRNRGAHANAGNSQSPVSGVRGPSGPRQFGINP